MGKSTKRNERKAAEAKLLTENINNPKAQAYIDRCRLEPYIKGVEITAYGMRVEFQAMPLRVANALLDAIDALRREDGVKTTAEAEQIRDLGMPARVG